MSRASNDLRKKINSISKQFQKDISKHIYNVSQVVAKETVKELRSTSPKGKQSKRRGRYAKGWRTQIHKGGLIVYNKTDGPLTHLLEYGHETIYRKKRVKRAKALPHIEKAQEKAYKNYLEKLKKEVEGDK